MGNYNTRSVRFLQSQNDFPLFVSLGDKKPSCGLSRWNGKNNLRFSPSDDEGFTLRGDRHRFLYKGRRRSHRFTILNDGAFEYDCILLKEPESNVIALKMEGAELYDFFKQPDFVPDDFLKGSYAVYKKETLVGEGTGKLCHIHRPLIIDSRGRKIWGELSVNGNVLNITIPEWWLASAKYPVTVDPTIGTNTVGSQNKWIPDPSDPYPEELFFEIAMPVNRFLVSEAINGLCTAYYYSNSKDSDGGGRPIIFSDSSNKPSVKKSSNENFINLNYAGSWRSGTFQGGSISSGSYIWFGLFTEYMWFPRFDFGVNCYASSWEDLTGIPYTYPIYAWNEIYNFKLSMYFTYTSAQNYVLTLTQGVNLSESKKIISEYYRVSAQTANTTDDRKLKADYKRNTFDIVNGSTAVNPLFTFLRECFETVGYSIGLSRLPVFNRFMNDDVKLNTEINNSREINRKFDDVISNTDIANRSHGFIKTITENILSFDNFDFSVLILRTIQDTQNTTDIFQQVRDYIRCLKIETAIITETERSGDFYRMQNDLVDVDGFSFRHLLIFIKLFSASFVRDVLLKRFLVSKEQIEMKSLITKDLRIESKIN